MVSAENEKGVSVLLDYRELSCGGKVIMQRFIGEKPLGECIVSYIGRFVEIKTIDNDQVLELRMVSKISKTENGTHISIYGEKIEVKDANGEEKIITFNKGNFFEIATIRKCDQGLNSILVISEGSIAEKSIGKKMNTKPKFYVTKTEINSQRKKSERVTKFRPLILANKTTDGQEIESGAKPSPEDVVAIKSETLLPKHLEDKTKERFTGSQKIKPSIIPASPSKITAKDIAEEIKSNSSLGINKIRILFHLIGAGREIVPKDELYEIENISKFGIPAALRELFRSNLIDYSGNKSFIKLTESNHEKIRSFYPWLYEKRVQEIASKFNFPNSAQNILYLLCKYPEGLFRNIVIAGIGLGKPGYEHAKKLMDRYELFRTGGRGKNAVILPNFLGDQAEEDPAGKINFIVKEKTEPSTDQTVSLLKTTVEEIIISSKLSGNQTKGKPVTSENSAVVKTSKIPEEVKSEKPTKLINEKLRSFIERIKRGSVKVSISDLSSQFKVGIKAGLTELLDRINKEIKIEIFDTSSGVVIISWKPKDFKNIVFENLAVRKKTRGSQTKDKGGQKEADQAIESVKPLTAVVEDVNEKIITQKEARKKI
ncbi:MAG: hypothetical protein KAS78_02860, partial [Candidatus Pacebacteria bacterium]|nr:hypothetical protein [Candidatus Paceibacterota bacterium]